MEYLAEIHFNQPVQMWAFWRVQIEAVFALANTASEAIPHAVAMVRSAEKKSPREAVEFVLQLLRLKLLGKVVFHMVHSFSQMVGLLFEYTFHLVKAKMCHLMGLQKESAVRPMSEEGGHREIEHAASSYVSVDAPRRNSAEAMSISNQNPEEVNSCPDHGSRRTASIGSAKVPSEGENSGKDLQCTADSSKVLAHGSSPGIMQDNNIDNGAQKYASLQKLSVPGHEFDGGSSVMISPPRHGKEKEKKKGKEKKRKRESHKHLDDPEYLERKRLKKDRKQKEKEMVKRLGGDMEASQSQLEKKREEASIKAATVQLKPNEASGSDVVITKVERSEPSEGSPAPPKFRIKIKMRSKP
ncbi:hypothetical protein HS088_TW15G00110 [Tripterygium wilfordii]|uniref:Transcription initiation factor TFIID subunit 2 n=1 Tax=Tripterygium wilfordii TaxID=458696 RepID=A0A7J7CKP5_TRIWF|nr:hypothetical protein HS088_TW15G00110 [Tripterygium wilfordii]